ncbi:MAG: hypothetical protein ABIO72_02790 [Patescibacteria group bacterium]
MVRLQDDSYSKVAETIKVLTQHSSFTSELGEQIRKSDGATRAIKAMLEEFFPPPAQTPSPAQGIVSSQEEHKSFFQRFRIPVGYEPIPSASELRKRFDHVDFGDYTSNDWAQEAWISKTRLQKGKKSLLVRSFHMKMTTEDVLREAMKKGYRLGLLQEALGIAEACPDFQRYCSFAVLGSTIILKRRSVAVLCGDKSTRKLCTMGVDTPWESSQHFLLVEDEERNDKDIEKFLGAMPFSSR